MVFAGLTSFQAALARGSTTGAQALAIFDALEPVAIESMLGTWNGHEFASGHPMDGALSAWHWQGKRFDSEEEVHPLLFRSWGRSFSIAPAWLVPGVPLLLRWPWLKSRAAGRIGHAFLPLFATQRSQARLRMMLHRGRVTATMVYDRAPILDVFRRVDADTVLGLMDFKGLEQPFFFVLRRAGA